MATQSCPHCAQQVRAGAFCSSCGKALGATACPGCRAQIRPGARFCPACGSATAASAAQSSTAPLLDGQRWVRRPDELAIRFAEVALEKRFFARELVVEEGTTGLVYQGGRFASALSPGIHRFGGLLESLSNALSSANPVSFVLVETAPVPLAFAIEDLPAQDGDRVDVALGLSVAVELPEVFAQSALRGQQRLTREELRSILAAAVSAGVASTMAAHPLEQFADDFIARAHLTDGLRSSLRDLLDRLGLTLEAVDSIAIASRRAAAARELDDEALRLLVEAQKAELTVDARVATASREERLRDAGHESQKLALDRRADLGDAEHGVVKSEQQRAQELAAAREAERLRVDAERHAHELTKAEKQRRQDLLLHEESERKRLEIEKAEGRQDLDLMGQMMAMKLEAERSRKATDLQVEMTRLEALKELSVEKILALNPNLSPVAAQALAAKFQADAGAERLSDQREMLAMQQAMTQQHLQQMGALMSKTVEAVTQVAGAARGMIAAPQLAVPALTSGATRYCDRCGTGASPGEAFCAGCGQSLSE